MFEGDKASSSWEFPEGFFIHGLFSSLGAEEVAVESRIVTNIPHPGNVWPSQELPGAIQLPNQPEILKLNLERGGRRHSEPARSGGYSGTWSGILKTYRDR